MALPYAENGHIPPPVRCHPSVPREFRWSQPGSCFTLFGTHASIRMISAKCASSPHENGGRSEAVKMNLSRIKYEALACTFHGVAFESGSMGERFFVRLTTAWRAMPREENGKATASGPLSNAKAQRSTKYKLDFTKLTFAKSGNGDEKGPTHEICRLGGAGLIGPSSPPHSSDLGMDWVPAGAGTTIYFLLKLVPLSLGPFLQRWNRRYLLPSSSATSRLTPGSPGRISAIFRA